MLLKRKFLGGSGQEHLEVQHQRRLLELVDS
jgi:hypothetical protein